MHRTKTNSLSLAPCLSLFILSYSKSSEYLSVSPCPWSSLVEGDEQRDRANSQTVPQYSSLPHGPIQPSSPSTKELHALSNLGCFSFLVALSQNKSFTTSHPINRVRRWYTVVMLLFDLYYWPFFIINGRGKNRSPSL